MPDRLAKIILGSALLLYAFCLLFSWDVEPLLLVAALILFSVGLYRSARAFAAAPNWQAPFMVRLHGPGKQGSDERKEWLFIQTQRGRSIRKVLLSVVVAALALFVENHVTGSIFCGRLVFPTPTEIRASGSSLLRWPGCEDEKALGWSSHADRNGRGATYPTKENDTFANIALVHDIPPSLIGPKNLAARFIADETAAKTLEVKDKAEVTIEQACQKLQATPAQVAARFATASLPAGQKLEIPKERPYDPRQWTDWLLWSLIGMTAYLLMEVARHLRNVPNGEGDFLGETSWYWTQLSTGPLIAFVILLLFVHIDVNLLTGDESAVEVNLREYPLDLLLVPAFLLGFYSRVARELLDQLTRKVFGAAWRAAYGDFEIVIKGQDIGDDEVSSSSSVTFETKPPMVGTVWNATDGTIDSAGIFKSPAQVDTPKKVLISAIAPGPNRSVVKAITVVKHKFNIDAPGNAASELHPGQEQKLAINPPLPAGDTSTISWELVPPVPEGISLQGNGADATLTVAETVTPGASVTVKSTLAGLSRTRLFVVKPGLTMTV